MKKNLLVVMMLLFYGVMYSSDQNDDSQSDDNTYVPGEHMHVPHEEKPEVEQTLGKSKYDNSHVALPLFNFSSNDSVTSSSSRYEVDTQIVNGNANDLTVVRRDSRLSRLARDQDVASRPISTEGMSDKNRQEWSQQVAAQIEKMHSQHDYGNVIGFDEDNVLAQEGRKRVSKVTIVEPEEQSGCRQCWTRCLACLAHCLGCAE